MKDVATAYMENLIRWGITLGIWMSTVLVWLSPPDTKLPGLITVGLMATVWSTVVTLRLRKRMLREET